MTARTQELSSAQSALYPLLALLFAITHAQAFASDSCKSVLYPVTLPDGTSVTRMVLGTPNRLIDPKGRSLESDFHLDHRIDLIERITTEAPQLGPCLERADEFEIVTDRFIMTGGAVLSLGPKGLLVRATEFHLDTSAIIETRNLEIRPKLALAITKTGEFPDKPPHGIRLIDYGKTGDAMLAPEFKASGRRVQHQLLSQAVSLANRLFRKSDARLLERADRLYAWVEESDPLTAELIKKDVVQQLEALRGANAENSLSAAPAQLDRSLYLFGFSNAPEKFRAMQEAIYRSGLIRKGFDFDGNPGRFIPSEELKPIAEICTPSGSVSELERASFVEKSRWAETLGQACNTRLKHLLAQGKKDSQLASAIETLEVLTAATSHPVPYDRILSAYKGALQFLSDLERERTALISANRNATESEKELKHLIDRQDTNRSQASKEVEFHEAEVAIANIESQRIQESIRHQLETIESAEEIRTKVRDLPIVEQNPNLASELGGFLGGAAAGAGLAASCPPAAIAMGAVGIVGFLGSRQQQTEVRNLARRRHWADIELRELQLDQELSRMAQAVADQNLQLDQAALRTTMTILQKEIGLEKIKSIESEIKYLKSRSRAVFNDLRPIDTYDEMIWETQERLRRYASVLISKIESLFKVRLHADDPNNRLFKDCLNPGESTSIYFNLCAGMIEDAYTAQIKATGREDLDPRSMGSLSYQFGQHVVTISPEITPGLTKSLKTLGQVSFELTIGRPRKFGGDQDDNFTIPVHQRVAEILHADIWYELVDEPQCDGVNSLFRIHQGAYQRYAPYSKVNDQILTFNAGNLALERTIVGTSKFAIKGRGGNYDRVTEGMVAEVFSRDPDANSIFVRHSPATLWRIELANPALADCLQSIKLAIRYRHL